MWVMFRFCVLVLAVLIQPPEDPPQPETDEYPTIIARESWQQDGPDQDRGSKTPS